MGHLRIGTLPKTKRWRDVVSLIGSGADVNVIAAETSAAAEKSLIDAGEDPVPRHVFYLLTQIPLAAKASAFPGSLRPLGIFIDGRVTLATLCGGFIEAVDRLAQSARDRTDLGELATLSAVETLSSVLGREQEELFESSDDDVAVHTALKRLSSADSFAELAHDFFARLTRRYLNYYLSRELPKHVGLAARFHSLREHRAFQGALQKHCDEAAEIVREFVSQWFSKRVYNGDLDERAAGWALQHGFDKVHKELRVRRDLDA